MTYTQKRVGDVLAIRGARVHNLKNIDVEIPHNQLTVITGVSGSGKSSLVFDVIYAEGQRRYVESLSAYARQFLERMERPDVDEILALAPPIAIRQRNTSRNPRSTVATATELYDYFRILWARIGVTWCPHCDQPVQKDSVDLVAHRMLAEEPGSRWYLLFPVEVASEAQQLRDRLFVLRKKGFNRLYQSGRTFEFSTPESLLDIDFSQPLFVLVDRLVMGAEVRSRLVDGVEICYREAGEAVFEQAGVDRPRTLRFSERFACKQCGLAFQTPEPRLFSFNNPFGACPRCQGFGNTIDYDMDLVIPDPSLSIAEGAVEPWTKPQYDWAYEDFRRIYGKEVRLGVPVCELTLGERRVLQTAIREFFDEVERKKYKVHVRVFLSRYRGYTLCLDCGGSRLRKEALYVRVGNCSIADVTRMNIEQAMQFFCSLELTLEQRGIAEKVLLEIQQRLKFLHDVGLGYITLDRLSSTLSGGEAQRIQLATCLGSRLVGTCYVLDEPSIGLHSRDTERLIGILKELRDIGNTILVVEHDPEVMRAADHIVDLGPGAGELGGRVLFSGSFRQLLQDGNGSLTARYLRGELRATQKSYRRRGSAKRKLRIIGARAHNLRNIDVEIPLDIFVAVTGVSGSGKSSLVHEVLYKALAHALRKNLPSSQEKEQGEQADRLWCRRLEGAHFLSDVVLVDQSPIGRTPRSNPVTYIKAFDLIRELFASTAEARRRGYSAGSFSFNIPGGRCEACQGAGTVTVEMQFLADVELVCEECKGTRYKSAILDVPYRNLNIYQVLQLTVREALDFFRDVPRLAARLKVLEDVGLGYLRLGQSATTLSGGEAQRVKLAAYLGAATVKKTLFIFDEPTTGLHFDDIRKLLNAFDRLIEGGGSVLVIEHNLEVIRSADYIIDLGPEGGAEGGCIVAQGTPEEVAACPSSHTGRSLRPLLDSLSTSFPGAHIPATLSRAP